jgi:predicted small secreted protein
MYNYKTDNDKITTYLVYGNKYNNYYIDALTGEKVQLQSNSYGPFYAEDMKMLKSNGAARNENLTPEELKAIKEASGLITQEKAEEIARNAKFLEISNDMKASYVSLYKDWNNKDNIVWNIEFSKESRTNSDDYRYASVRIDAKTGEMLEFNTSYPQKGDEKAKYNENESKAAVEKFLKEFALEKFNNVTFNENYQQNIILYASTEKQELPKNYNFSYVRMVNSIPFMGNGIYINFDAVSGKVTSYNCQWFNNAKFDSAQNSVSIDKVYDKVFNEVGYYLQYKLKYNRGVYEKYSDAIEKPEVKLVYASNPQKPLLFDAFKNILLNQNGEPYKENKANYTDIEDSFAKMQITALAENGIMFDGDKFNPNANITQKDYLYMIAKTLFPYETYKLTEKDDLDRMYGALTTQGVIKKNEKSPYAAVKREDAVKFIIRAMNFGKVADIKGIYNCQFKDVNEISEGLVGYITIASGLNIISGDEGCFKPQEKMTRAQAAVVIYNFMQK